MVSTRKTKRGRGRPPTGVGTPIHVRVSDALLAAIDRECTVRAAVGRKGGTARASVIRSILTDVLVDVGAARTARPRKPSAHPTQGELPIAGLSSDDADDAAIMNAIRGRPARQRSSTGSIMEDDKDRLLWILTGVRTGQLTPQDGVSRILTIPYRGTAIQ